MRKDDIKKKFDKLVLYEYTNLGDTIDEVGEDQVQYPMAGGDQGMGGDPMAGGDQGMMDTGMGGDPMAGGDPGVGGDPMAGGDPGMGGDPMAGGGGEEPASPPEGFSPQGVDQNAGLEGMGGDQQQNDEQPMNDTEEEVIDVDDLTDSQEKTEKKVDSLTDKFSSVISALKTIVKKIDDSDKRTSDLIANIKGEVEKRNPTPMQRLSMRSAQSAPYAISPETYMEKYAPENYSAEDDNNGADDPQYKITKADIDNFTNYGEIAREFKNKNSLRDIFGY